MARKNHLLTPDERAQHDLAVKLRKMTDKQLLDYIAAHKAEPTPVPAQVDEAKIIAKFIDLCAEKGHRMGPATIAGMRNVAQEAGYDLGV